MSAIAQSSTSIMGGSTSSAITSGSRSTSSSSQGVNFRLLEIPREILDLTMGNLDVVSLAQLRGTSRSIKQKFDLSLDRLSMEQIFNSQASLALYERVSRQSLRLTSGMRLMEKTKEQIDRLNARPCTLVKQGARNLSGNLIILTQLAAVRIGRVPLPRLPVAMNRLNSWACRLSIILLNPKPTDLDHTINFCISELDNIRKNPSHPGIKREFEKLIPTMLKWGGRYSFRLLF